MRDHPLFKAYLALAAVCFFWGTTYLGIRVGLETLPPLFMVSARFLLSGLILMAFVRWRGMYVPRGREMLWTSFNGILTLGVGNACLTYSERFIPSSLAALFIAVSPFWLIGLESVVPGGERARWPMLTGILAGFGGASLLFLPSLVEHGMRGAVWQGFLLLQLGSASWALGSILQKRHDTRAHPVASAAVQQLAGGLAFLIPTLLTASFPREASLASWLAFAWLLVFGSIVGYTSYLYALEHLPVALVSIYTYVNPVVAAALGWAFYREPFGRREALAMAIIFTGVALVKRFTVTPSRAPSRTEPLQSSSVS